MTWQIETTEQFVFFWGMFAFAGTMIIVGCVSTLRFFVQLEQRIRSAVVYRKWRRMGPVSPARFSGEPSSGPPAFPAYSTADPAARAGQPLRREAGPRDWAPRGGM